MNNGFPEKKIVDAVKTAYPAGCTVVLDEMHDPFREMPAGLKGTVVAVDDIGTVHVSWENGSSLGVAYGVDRIHRVYKNTKVTYLYRDASNYKTWNEVVLKGTITPEPPTPTPGGEGTITPEPPTPTPGGDTPINPSITPGGSGDIEYMYVYGEILWEDSDNAYNTRPSEATVRLVRGSTIVEEIVVEPDSDGKWLYSFDPVPRYGISGSTPQEVSQSGELPEAGASGSARNKGDREELVYTLKQKDVEGYNWYTTILSSQINDDTLDVSTTVTDVLKSRSTVTPTTGPDEEQPSNNNNNSNTNSNSGHSTIVNSNTSYGGSSSSRTGSGKTTTSPIVKESGRSTVSNASNASNAKAGDETDLMLLFSMLGLSLMVILYCRKRKAAR